MYGCFDPDLLRLALVWRSTGGGEFLQMNSMSAGSYRVSSLKAAAGQKKLPQPLGTPICATGIRPGWVAGETAEAGAGGDVGRGPLPREKGRFLGIQIGEGTATLRYEVAGTRIDERVLAIGKEGFLRMFGVAAHAGALSVELGENLSDTLIEATEGVEIVRVGGRARAVIAPDAEWRAIAVAIGGALPEDWDAQVGAAGWPMLAPSARWPGAVVMDLATPGAGDSFVIDEIPLPLPNPWKRNVRLSGVGFFADGRAVVTTFDGDVWMVTGADRDVGSVEWRRFASGLHEPMALQVVADEVFVFDRNGIWRLHDENGDGEADFHEMWSDVVPQTAETREFAMGLLAKSGGGFYVVKGGQAVGSVGIANGTICEVSADGRSYTIVAKGLRQPYAGIDKVTGTITSSDQQGNWVPATPIHLIGGGRHYGFVPSALEQVPHEGLQEPALWIPHIVNQSGASQVWLRDAEMGALNDSLIHIGYNRPELFKIYLDQHGKMAQGAVASAVSGFPCALLHGAVNPADGQLYVCGFRIWGTALDQISGLFRVRDAGGVSTLPTGVRSQARGVLLQFGFELDAALATSPMSYTVERWNYRRTKDYGSGHYKLDGEPGQESMPVASATLSKDGKSVFLAIPSMAPVHTLAVRYRQAQPGGVPEVRSVYLTVHQLNAFDLRESGFASDEVSMEIDPSMLAAVAAAPDPSAQEGKKVATTFGCVACHSVDGAEANALPGQVVGPAWTGLWGMRRELSDGSVQNAVDAAYLRESIFEPGAKLAKGFEEKGVGMPSYLGVLQDWQVQGRGTKIA